MKNILQKASIILMLGGFIALLGTIGSSDLDLITFGQLVSRTILYVGIIGVGYTISRYTFN